MNEKKERNDRSACDRSNGQWYFAVDKNHIRVFFKLITRVSNLFINIKIIIMLGEWDGSVAAVDR